MTAQAPRSSRLAQGALADVKHGTMLTNTPADGLVDQPALLDRSRQSRQLLVCLDVQVPCLPMRKEKQHAQR
jgi:hypothetical protein